MSDESTCPGARLLRRLSLGQLPDDEAESVERHLLGCPRCVAAVRGVAGESPLVGLLRHRSAVEVPQGADVEAVVGRVREAAAAAGAETRSYPDPDTPG